MSTEEIKSVISNIIGVPVSEAWDILDSKPEVGLYLIHYKDGVNMSTYGHIRGIIIDIEQKIIVCDAYRYTPIVRSDHLEFDDKGEIVFYDTVGKRYVTHKDKMRIVPGFEVVTIRAFLHRGIVYFPSYRKIDVWSSDSRWGKSIPFSQMAKDLKIPDGGTLFPDKSKMYSNYTHIFMLVHQGILNVTKADIGNGYIVYAGTKSNPAEFKVAPEIIDTTPVKLETTNDVEVAKRDLVLLKPDDFNINQANQFLKHGYYSPQLNQKDTRLNCGEFVIVYLDVNNLFSQVIRVESNSYRWRTLITDDHPNLRYRYYCLLNLMKTNLNDPASYKNFSEILPRMSRYSFESIIERVNVSPIPFWVNKGNPFHPHTMTPDDFMYNIWAALMMAVPLHKQKEVAKLYDEYMSNKKHLVVLLEEIYKIVFLSKKQIEVKNPRVTQLLQLAHNKAISSMNLKANQEINTSILEDFLSCIRYNLQYLVNGEEGSSLYRVYKECLNIKTNLDAPEVPDKDEDNKEILVQ